MGENVSGLYIAVPSIDSRSVAQAMTLTLIRQ